jgi:hypothetical protein
MVFVRGSCIAWNHKGNKGMQDQDQLKSWLHIFYSSHPILIGRYDISISKITMDLFHFTYTCFPLSPTAFLLDVTKGNTVGVL